MGCGSSVSQVMDSKEAIFRPLRLLQMESEKERDFSNGKIFLFGETKTQRKIVECEIKANNIKSISNRTRIPLPKINLDPLQTLYQESQEIFHLGIYGFSMLPPFNRMLALYMQSNLLFVCGGKDYDNYNVKNQSFFYSIVDQNVKIASEMLPNNQLSQRTFLKSKYSQNKFQKMSSMSKKRYGHTGIYCYSLKSVLVFGGKNQHQQILSSCESYAILQNSWKDLPPMKVPRSNAHCFQYANKIYVFGGRASHEKLSKKIQVYSIEQNDWELLKFKLHRGIERALILSASPNQILIIGGKTYSGCSKSVIKINLKQQSYVWDSQLQGEYRSTKGTTINDQIFIFGGEREMAEIYINQKWKKGIYSHRKIVEIDDLEQFSFSQESLIVKNIDITTKQQHASDEQVVFFGNDAYPCLLFYNKVTNAVRMSAVPMTLRLKSNMGIIEIQKNVYMLIGGSDKSERKPSRSCYFYDQQKNKAVSTVKMPQKKFYFGVVHYQNYVYIFGGYDCIQKIALTTCQKFNLREEKWQQMPSLSKPMLKVDAEIFGKGKIAIIGGEKKQFSMKEIQIYNVSKNCFEVCLLKTEIPPSIIAMYQRKQQQEVIILRKNQSNQLFEFLLSELTSNKKVTLKPLVQPPEQTHIQLNKQRKQRGPSLNQQQFKIKKIHPQQSQELNEQKQVHKQQFNKIVELKPQKIGVKARYSQSSEIVKGQELDNSFQIQKIKLQKTVMMQSHQSGKFILQDKVKQESQFTQMHIQQDVHFVVSTNSLSPNISKMHRQEQNQISNANLSELIYNQKNQYSGQKIEFLYNREYRFVKRQNQNFFIGEQFIITQDLIKLQNIQKKVTNLKQIKFSQLS